MSQRITRRILTFSAVAVITASIAGAQSQVSPETIKVADAHTWLDAQSAASSGHKLFLVTLDKPDRRQACRVQSFSPEEVVCSRAIGGPRTYLRQQLLAIILPGDDGLRVKLLLWFNGGLGAAIVGTVVLVATCPACAAATALAALLFFSAAGAVAYGDQAPDSILYLAPGRKLSRKFGRIQR
jgi:hypothetical protein